VRERSDRMEWAEVEEKDFTIAFGHSGTDRMLYVRILGEKDGAKAHVEWCVDVAWVRALLDRWFPPNQPHPRDDAMMET